MIGLFPPEFPYSDYHQLNLDWILQTMKQVKSEWENWQNNIQDYIDNVIPKYIETEVNKQILNFAVQMYYNAEDTSLNFLMSTQDPNYEKIADHVVVASEKNLYVKGINL